MASSSVKPTVPISKGVNTVVAMFCNIWMDRNKMKRRKKKPSTIQYNTIQYNTIQYNTTQHNTLQQNTQHTKNMCPLDRKGQSALR